MGWRNPVTREFDASRGDDDSWGSRAIRAVMFGHPWTSLQRIWAGARHACARLRRERDEARAECGARDAAGLAWDDDVQYSVLRADRDLARRELRALEWLWSRHGSGRWWYEGSAAMTGDGCGGVLRHDSYSTCATALGWEG